MNIFYSNKEDMIGGKLLSEGGYGCVFHPEVNCEGKEIQSKDFVTKIQQKDFSAENEIKIGKILKEKYENRKDKPLINNFVPVISSCPIKMSKLKIDDKDNCKVFKKIDTTNMIMLKIRYVDSKDFDTYIIENKNSSMIFLTLISAYNYLLKSLALIQNANIVHFDIKGQNIVFDLKKVNPIIIDFGLSLPMDQIKNTNLYDYFYVYAPEYYVWPLEVHYINFLLHVNENPTENDLKNMIKTYISKNAAFDGFSKEFKKDFYTLCLNELKKYSELSLVEKKNKVLKSWNSWDNYSISIVYLKFLFYITKTNSEQILKNNFVQHFTEILLLNIHPDPNKRLGLVKSMKLFNKFLFDSKINNTSTFQDITENMSKNKTIINKTIMLNQRKLKTVTEQSIRTALR